MFDDLQRQSIDELQEFSLYGDKFTKLDHNKEKDLFLFERRSLESGLLKAWEIVKPVIRDGVRVYPGTSQFGKYGKCISATEPMRKRMNFLFSNGW